MSELTGYPDCPKCGGEDVYVYGRQRANGSVSLGCANPDCRCQFSSLVGTIWHRSKLSAAQQAEMDELARSDMNANQIAKKLGRDYKWVWVRINQLRAANAR